MSHDSELENEPENSSYERFEARLAEALCSADPGPALEALRAEPDFAAPSEHVSEDGFRLAALLVVRLRFERLLNGSRVAGHAWNEDPRGFTERFKQYHAAVRPCAWTPAEEARQYEAWLSTGGTSGSC